MKKSLKNIIILIVFLFGTLLFIRFVFGGDEDTWICEDGVWVKHGQPSDPVPNGGCGEEIVVSPVPSLECGSMDINKALEIARKDCMNGKIQDSFSCNENSKTWWIDFSPDEPKSGCNPACVVDTQTGEAQINWRCTGLIEPTM